MSNTPESARPKDATSNVLAILFGAIAGINLLQQQWLDGATWASLAIAMLLTQDMDLSRPGVWKQPRYLLGIGLTIVAVALIIIRLAVDLTR